MKILVVGYGRVGARTAQVLAEEGQEVTIVDTDPEKVRTARDRGFTVIEGDGRDEAVLIEAGLPSAVAVGGITGDIETNHAICLIGAEYGCRTVMRISEDIDPAVYDRYQADVDAMIYPERFGAAGAKTALLGGDFNALGELTEGLQILVMKIPEDAPTIGAHVNEVDLGNDGRIYAHGRDDEPLTIPLPGTVIDPGDRVALLAATGSIDDVKREIVGS